MADVIPIILCGKTEQIGQAVIEGLKPDIEVVHFILTPEAGIVEIPQVLDGTIPTRTIGTGNLSTPVKAIVLGGAYDADAVSKMREAVGQGPQVPWLSQDPDVPTPPLGPEYGKAMVVRVKEALWKMQASGRLDSGDGGCGMY